MREGASTSEWPVDLRGVTESVVTTLGPKDLWNAAALGLHAEEPVRARTWGHTRTRRNFERERAGVVQFTRDPLVFVEAALGIEEADEPVLDSADAWVAVEVDRLDSGKSGETEWVDWRLDPVESGVESTTVPTTNRGYNAVVEATVVASRLDVPAYDTDVLLDRLEYFETVARRCGGRDEREAFDRLLELIDRPSAGAVGDEEGDGDDG
ncbi:MAG: DUF447 domain-containing protein [Halanaeroarchaeum sp.]